MSAQFPINTRVHSSMCYLEKGDKDNGQNNAALQWEYNIIGCNRRANAFFFSLFCPPFKTVSLGRELVNYYCDDRV